MSTTRSKRVKLVKEKNTRLGTLGPEYDERSTSGKNGSIDESLEELSSCSRLIANLSADQLTLGCYY